MILRPWWRQRAGQTAVLGLLLVGMSACQSDGRSLRKPDVEFAPSGLTAESSLSISPEVSQSSLGIVSARRILLKPNTVTMAYSNQELTGDSILPLGNPNEFATMTALPVRSVSSTGTAVEVDLPGVATPATGWIAAGAGTIDQAPQTMVVDPARKTVTLYEGGDVLLSSVATFGAAYTTISGTSQFVMAILEPTDTSGGLGAYGVASSRTTTAAGAFIPGPNQVVIHGFDATEATSEDTTKGIIALPSTALEQLVRQLQPGTTIQFLAAPTGG